MLTWLLHTVIKCSKYISNNCPHPGCFPYKQPKSLTYPVHFQHSYVHLSHLQVRKHPTMEPSGLRGILLVNAMGTNNLLYILRDLTYGHLIVIRLTPNIIIIFLKMPSCSSKGNIRKK